jgi:hypothetical protein
MSNVAKDRVSVATPTTITERPGIGASAPLAVAGAFALLLLAGSGFLLPDTLEAFAQGLMPFWSLFCQ